MADEFAFPLGAQGYDFFYSHGTTNSAGVCTAVRRNLGVNSVKLVDVFGCLLGVDFTYKQTKFRVLNIYALNNSVSQRNFFNCLSQHCVLNLFLLGNFNSITDTNDRMSSNLDSTSALLSSTLLTNNLQEPLGSQQSCFTFHCPGVPDCQSRIDRIYTNFDSSQLFGYNFHVSFSDHYGVALCRSKRKDLGPQPW